jgi:DNA mismatch repair ATPase MutS
MNVAKLEAECLLTSFTKRVKTIELCGVPTYTLNNTVRRLETLPVKVTLY